MSEDTPTPPDARRGSTRRLCRLAGAALVSFAVSSAVISASTPPAVAQDSSGLGHPQILITPYLWLGGVYSTTTTPLARIPEVNSSVGPFELLGHLTGAPFMGSAEIHDGPISLLGDVFHIPVSTNITTRNVLFQGGKAELQANSGTALVLYRLLESANQFADLGAAFRV